MCVHMCMCVKKTVIVLTFVGSYEILLFCFYCSKGLLLVIGFIVQANQSTKYVSGYVCLENIIMCAHLIVILESKSLTLFTITLFTTLSSNQHRAWYIEMHLLNVWLNGFSSDISKSLHTHCDLWLNEFHLIFFKILSQLLKIKKMYKKLKVPIYLLNFIYVSIYLFVNKKIWQHEPCILIEDQLGGAEKGLLPWMGWHILQVTTAPSTVTMYTYYSHIGLIH